MGRWVGGWVCGVCGACAAAGGGGDGGGRWAVGGAWAAAAAAAAAGTCRRMELSQQHQRRDLPLPIPRGETCRRGEYQHSGAPRRDLAGGVPQMPLVTDRSSCIKQTGPDAAMGRICPMWPSTPLATKWAPMIKNPCRLVFALIKD